MKQLKLSAGILFLLIALISCSKKDGIDQDVSFLNSAATTNAAKIFDISNDNSGNVKITPTGEGASSFTVAYGHGTGAGASAVVTPGGSTTHAYPEGSYTVTITAKDIAGHETSKTYPLQLTYRAPENLAVTLTQSAHNLKVKATALYAASYLVYFGDVPNEVGTPLATGAQLSHDYLLAGPYNVKVVALSGGAATSEKVTVVNITDPFALPIDYENPFVNYFFGTFGGGQQFSTVANPNATGLNTSSKVGRFSRGFESWSGTYSPLNAPIDFATGNKVKVLAYNPDPALIGKKLNIELESGTISNGIAVLKVAFTTSGAWEELVFDFSTIPAIPANAKFNQLVLRFNDAFNGNGVGGTGSVFYLDNFRFTN
jgi:hypothetical protein